MKDFFLVLFSFLAGAAAWDALLARIERIHPWQPRAALTGLFLSLVATLLLQ